jgi:hypothetical protein
VIEKKYRKQIPELALSDAIGRESPYRPHRRLVRLLARLVVKEPRYRETGNLHSDGKIELFYKSVVVILVLAAVVVATMGGIKWEKPATSDRPKIDVSEYGPG